MNIDDYDDFDSEDGDHFDEMADLACAGEGWERMSPPDIVIINEILLDEKREALISAGYDRNFIYSLSSAELKSLMYNV